MQLVILRLMLKLKILPVLVLYCKNIIYNVKSGSLSVLEVGLLLTLSTAISCPIFLSYYYHLILLFFQVAAKKYCNFEIPAHFTGVWRYLENADEREEFSQTCPADIEIEKAYFSVGSIRK